MIRTRVKVCGITRRADAMAAVDYGVDALGFIFAKKSPRNIAAEKAWEIIRQLPSFVSCVGVFVNSDIEEVKGIVAECGLAQVQLHGDEPVEYCRQLKDWRRSLSICKAFRVRSESRKEDLDCYRNDADSILLDTYVGDREGGTGKTFDWNIVDRLGLQNPLILAGGLTPENIMEAIIAVKPFAVDVNSGVEDSPGVKNHQRLQAIFDAVRRVDQEQMKS